MQINTTSDPLRIFLRDFDIEEGMFFTVSLKKIENKKTLSIPFGMLNLSVEKWCAFLGFWDRILDCFYAIYFLTIYSIHTCTNNLDSRWDTVHVGQSTNHFRLHSHSPDS